jgi:hypothetical protein
MKTMTTATDEYIEFRTEPKTSTDEYIEFQAEPKVSADEYIEFQAERKTPVHGREPKRFGAKQPTSIFRLALPLVYAGMGVALGTLTGIGMAFMTTPVGATVADNDSPPAVSTTNNPGPALAKNVVPNAMAQAEVAVQMAAQTSEAKANEQNTGADQSSMSTSATKLGVKEEQTPSSQTTPAKMPEAEGTPAVPVEPAVMQPKKRAAHPLTAPARKEMASAPAIEPVVLDAADLSIENGAKPSGFYSEGDLTVADYDAAGGTIETSDGRVFVVGQTVSQSSATSWEDYRSSVHYRCGGDGSCTLMREGVIAPNAKLVVQTI